VGFDMTDQLLLFDLEDTYDFSSSDDEGKTCSLCGKYKPIASFSFATSAHNYRESKCTKCRSDLKRKSTSILKEQTYPSSDYFCPVCERTSDQLQRYGRKNQGAWAADHCHKTGEFRGWLCYPCNISLGMLQDDVVIISRAIVYLEKNTCGIDKNVV